ncbi:MAG TPA: ABC transporter ATP-binding protein [Humisphaera sp.]
MRARAAFYRRAVSYFRADWKLVALWFALIGLGTGLGLLAPWPMAVLADSVLAPASAAGHQDFLHRLFLAPLPGGVVGQIVGLAVAGLQIKVAQLVLDTVQTIVKNQVNYSGLLRVRCDLFRKLQALSLDYHRARPQGDAIYRLNSDAYGCQTVLNVLVSTVVAAVTLVAMTAVLGSRNWTLTLLAFSIAPLLAVCNVVWGRRLKARSLECSEADSRFTTVVQRAMSCIGLVQAFGREDEEFGQFRGTISETIRCWWRLNREQITYNVLTGLLFGFGGAVIFGYGGYLVYQGRLSVGDLLVFTGYLGMIWGPLCQLTGFAASVQGGVAGAERVFEVLDRDPTIREKPGAVSLPRKPRTLELENVGFGYAEGRPVLRDVSVRIEPGEMVAFVGASGAGKSTLLNLIPRFYDPSAGRMLLDGVDARDVKLKDLRRHVALVLQESVILPTSVAENIAYGRPGATREQIVEAARLAGAASFIEALPDGYDTVVNEGGANLSGGQRQRISIARALLTEAPIIVLDEPTSALDPLHERLITETLASLKGKRTIVVVSHRLSTVTGCDQIFVMDGGRVVEQGTHNELVGLGRQYHAMAVHQLQLDPPPAVRAA